MLKKLIGLLSRKTIPQDAPVISGTSARIVDLISEYLRVPGDIEEERKMSELAAAALGEDALPLLPCINSKLSESGWEVVWAQGKITFVYVSARKQRYLELFDEIAAVSSKHNCRAAEVYLTGICTAFVELDSWLKERPGAEEADKMLDANEALRLALAKGWTFTIFHNDSGQRFFCSAKAPRHSEDSGQWPKASAAVAPTIH